MRLERLRHLAEVRISNVDKKAVEGQVPVRLCNYTDVYYHERITSDLDFMEATATPDQCVAFQLSPGDVLLTKDSETPDDIGVAAVVVESSPRTLCGYHLAVVRPRGGRVDGRYLRYAIASGPARGQMASLANGITRFGLRANSIGNVMVPMRPIEEQRAIVDHLDRETTRIDVLVEKIQRLIETSDERFRAYRVASILGTLDPILGIGRTEWESMSFGRLIRLQRGLDLPADDRDDGAIPVISSGGVSGSHSKAACFGPGVVTGRYGTIGEVFFVDEPYWPLNTTLYVSEFRGNDPRWVFHLLSCLPLEVDSGKSAVTGINRNALAFMRVPRPPLEAQRATAQDLDSAMAQVNRFKVMLRRQIDVLLEKRQALITVAVTEQVPIPGAA